MIDQDRIHRALRNRRIAEMIAQEINAGYYLQISGGYVYGGDYETPEAILESLIDGDRLTIAVEDDTIYINTISPEHPEEEFSYYFSDDNETETPWSELPAVLARVHSWLNNRASKVSFPNTLMEELGKIPAPTLTAVNAGWFTFNPTISLEVARKLVDGGITGQEVDGYIVRHITEKGRGEYASTLWQVNLQIVGTNNHVGFTLNEPSNPEFPDEIPTNNEGTVNLTPLTVRNTYVLTPVYEPIPED